MIDIPEAFQMQARTVRAFYSDGNVSDATVYSGFAMKENGNTLLQVELNDNRDGRFLVMLKSPPPPPPLSTCESNSSNFYTPATVLYCFHVSPSFRTSIRDVLVFP